MRVRLREEALDDLRRVFDWYADRNPAVARTMIARVRARLDQLAAFPELGERTAGRSDRTLYVSRTPLVVVYRVEEGADHIDILGVFHAARHPSVRTRP